MENSRLFFEQLVRAYSTDLYRYALWLSKNPTVAEDLVQESFLRAWRSIDKLKDEKAAKAWLVTIVRRENARRFERYSPVILELEEAMIEESDEKGPLETLEKQQMYQAIKQLDEKYREPLLLQLIWGFTNREIAEQLEEEQATINTRLFRARKQLSALFDASQTPSLSSNQLGGGQ
jgi:RNA polymerase sigma-70 factor (ECF subfamily)